MKTIDRLEDKHIIQLHQLYQQEWWTKERTLEVTRKIADCSSVIIGLVDEKDNLVAFARVLSDYIAKAIIFDVIVKENYRHQGLGQRIIDAILSHKKLKEVKHFELYCLPEMVPFYKKLGFTNKTDGLVLLRSKRNVRSHI